MSDGTLKFDTDLDAKGFTSGLGKVSSIAQQALGVFTGQMMTKAVDGIVNLGKSALDSVSSLEQNVGGVQTLFSSAADAVISNAENAYKTAGMSANDYMQTVTSFSASLLQSLGGDTEAAAKASDMAIVDMSDNANKMGTNLGSIQYAYQGFAKQNYTMLDNLKLGYGGSRQEMERLLQDAEKLSGQKYDISNLNDVYNAIHVVQTEMGITGTTAKEASTTIEGSMNSAKAAWDNFMNGSGDAQELADAVSQAAGNITSNLGQIITRLVSTIPQLADAIVPQIPSLVQGLLPALSSAIMGLLESLGSFVTGFDWAGMAQSVADAITGFISSDGLSKFVQSAADIITGLVTGIAQALPLLLPAVIKLIYYIISALVQALPQLIKAGWELIKGFVAGILSAVPTVASGMLMVIQAVLAALVQIGIDIWNFITDVWNKFTEWGRGILNIVVPMLTSLVSTVVKFVSQLPGKIWTWLVNAVNRVIQWGSNMVSNARTAMSNMLSAIVNGIKDIPSKVGSKLTEAANKVSSWAADLASRGASAASGLVNAVIGGLGGLAGSVRSIGSNIVTGLWNGISGGWTWLTNQVRSLAGNLLAAAKSALKIGSPSRAFRDEVGKWILPGVEVGMEATMPNALKEMEANALALVGAAKGAVYSSTADIKQSAGSSMMTGAVSGTTVYNDNHVTQTNTYNTPVASPSEIAKSQREAVRKLVGGVS